MDGNPVTVTSKLTSGTASTLGDTRSDVQCTNINNPIDHRRNRRHQSGRGHNRTPQSHFKSSVEGLEDAVYNSGLPNSSQDLFTTTTEQIGEYVAKTYEHAGEFRTGLMNLSFPILEKPRDPGKDHNNKNSNLSMRTGRKQSSKGPIIFSEYLLSSWGNAVIL